MRRELTAVEARQKFGELLDRAYYRDDEIVIKRDNKAMAVIVSSRTYERYLKQRENDFDALERIWAKMPTDTTEEQAESDADRAIEETRALRRRNRVAVGSCRPVRRAPNALDAAR